MKRKIVLRYVSLICVVSVLAACSTPPQQQPQDTLYVRLEQSGTQLDPVAAVSLINAYRRANGLAPLQLDGELMRVAEQAADKAAREDRSTFGEMPQLPLSAGRPAQVKLSAGYLTMAEAFSGWRDVPLYNKTLLSREARALGIAAIRAPQGKYRVYWALATDG